MTTTATPTLLHALHAGLDSGDYNAVADLFSADGLWMPVFGIKPQPADSTLPPPRGTTAVAVDSAAPGNFTDEALRGREVIRDYLKRRGTVTYRHQITNYLVTDELCFIEGIAVADSLRAMFFASARTRDGEITRYVGSSVRGLHPATLQRAFDTRLG